MRLKVIADGTTYGTRVEDAATGEPLDGVVSATFHYGAGQIPTLTVELIGFDAEIEAEADVVRIPLADEDDHEITPRPR